VRAPARSQRFLVAAGAVLFAVTTTIGLLAVRSAARSTAGSAGADDDARVARGRELFLVQCASCHGLDGSGTDQGPDLRDVGAAAADFQLRTGRMPNTNPTREPESKPSPFSDQEIEDLVAYVASLGPGPPIPNVKSPPGDLAEGGNLFRLNCAACHSAAGDGGALTEGRDAPDLHHIGSVQIAEAIRTGPSSMPVFGPDTFTDEQVNSIVKYVRYLRSPDNRGGLSLDVIGPITEGLVAILFGLGAIVLLTRWIEPRTHDVPPVDEVETPS
jgi:quinol---cytochrome-c reductase cytochrome c subunit